MVESIKISNVITHATLETIMFSHWWCTAKIEGIIISSIFSTYFVFISSDFFSIFHKILDYFKCILCYTNPIHSWWFYCICVRVVWGIDKVPIFFCCWHVLKAWCLCGTQKIKNVEVWDGILQDFHDVMYMSINREETIDDFKEHGKVVIKESLHKHRLGDVWTNYF